jgi:putative DNA primase/helicase
MPPPPQSVADATLHWRKSADVLLRFIEDALVFDPESHVMARELFEVFKSWMSGHGHTAWTDQNFGARLAQHPQVLAAGVEKRNGIRPNRSGLSRVSDSVVPGQFAAWMGVRFKGGQ